METQSSYQGNPNAIYQEPGFSFYEPLKDPADETMADIRDRMIGLLRSLVQRHAGTTIVVVSHADPITIMRLGLEVVPLTARNLHRTVYSARASVLQIEADHDAAPRLTYFDIVGEGAT